MKTLSISTALWPKAKIRGPLEMEHTFILHKVWWNKLQMKKPSGANKPSLMDSSETFSQPAEPFASSSMLPFGAGPTLDVCHSPFCHCLPFQTSVMHRPRYGACASVSSGTPVGSGVHQFKQVQIIGFQDDLAKCWTWKLSSRAILCHHNRWLKCSNQEEWLESPREINFCIIN